MEKTSIYKVLEKFVFLIPSLLFVVCCLLYVVCFLLSVFCFVLNFKIYTTLHGGPLDRFPATIAFALLVPHNKKKPHSLSPNCSSSKTAKTQHQKTIILRCKSRGVGDTHVVSRKKRPAHHHRLQTASRELLPLFWGTLFRSFFLLQVNHHNKIVWNDAKLRINNSHGWLVVCRGVGCTLVFLSEVSF